MVAGTHCLLALLLPQVLLGSVAILFPELGQRRFAASAGSSSSQPSDDVLSEIELRLLSVFGPKRRPTPIRVAAVPPYTLDLDRRLERAASLADTVRSVHREGEAWSSERGSGAGGRSSRAAPPRGQIADVPGRAPRTPVSALRTSQNLALTHWLCGAGASDSPLVNPHLLLACSQKSDSSPETGEESSDGEDEGKRHAPSQLTVQFHRGRMRGRRAERGLPKSVWKPLLCKSASPASARGFRLDRAEGRILRESIEESKPRAPSLSNLQLIRAWYGRFQIPI